MGDTDSNLLYQIALTQIKGVGDSLAKNLISTIGDEQQIFKSSKKSLTTIKGISDKVAAHILDKEVLIKAEKELNFVLKNKIQVYYFRSEKYPYRLKECIDSPILFYFKGKANLDSNKIISIVGTRKSTEYGNYFCSKFLEELSQDIPDLLVVSGLAYGIDINAHRAALSNSLPTVGVVAHGLDSIYPAVHRKTAIEMIPNGGLLSEFCSGTGPDKFNFVRRNRIIAGISDATIVVESDKKGGSLITADIADSYNKQVFAIPGRIYDTESSGCNMLIEQNKAILLNSVDNFIKHMQWDIDYSESRKKIIEPTLFPMLNEKEETIFNLLRSQTNPIHFNLITNQLGIQPSLLISTLVEMEMKGIIVSKPGNLYLMKQ